jgi:hypothetical protein
MLGNNSIKNILYELRGWADADLKRYQSNCEPPSMDIWVHHARNCPTDYQLGDVLGSKSCLLIKEFTKRQAVYRYSLQTGCEISGSNDFPTIGEAVGSYIENLNTYITESNSLLENLKENNNSLGDEFKEISEQVLTILKKMEMVINPLVEIFENEIGNNALYEFLNCCNFYLNLIF